MPNMIADIIGRPSINAWLTLQYLIVLLDGYVVIITHQTNNVKGIFSAQPFNAAHTDIANGSFAVQPRTRKQNHSNCVIPFSITPNFKYCNIESNMKDMRGYLSV